MSLGSKRSMRRISYLEKTDYQPVHRVYYRSGRHKTAIRLTRERAIEATRPAREALALAKKGVKNGV